MEYTELKIRLMQQGAVFTDDAKKNMCRNRFGQFVFNDYATTGGVVLEMDGRVYANVPVKYGNTPFCIDYADGRFVVKMEEKEAAVSVRIMPVPQFALNNILLDNGTPVRDLVMTHADRLRISPVHGCSYHCQFCTCNNQRYREIPCEDLNQAVQIALADPYNRPRHILISGGTPDATECAYTYLNEVYRFFPEAYPQYEFDVMLSPRGLRAGDHSVQGYVDFLSYLREECGVQTLSVNLELYNERFRRAYIPDKQKIGMERYRCFIEKAVRRFGKGNVRSSLIVGLEDLEDTKKGVEMLCSLGCTPVLSAFVPDVGTAMASFSAPYVAFLLETVAAASEIAGQYGMEPGPTLCRPCTHNSITNETGSVSFIG